MSHRYNYKTLGNTYGKSCVGEYSESFFVRYAVEGPMQIPEEGLRAEMPVSGPIEGPVREPSNINSPYYVDSFKCKL